MRWLARIFANAIARRVAYVVVAIALAWCGIGKAQAQSSDCHNPTVANAFCPDRAQAYAALVASAEWRRNELVTLGGYVDAAVCEISHSGPPSNQYSVSVEANGWCPGPFNRWRSYVVECPEGATWDEETKSCGTCDTKPPFPAGNGWRGVTVNGSGEDTICQDSCEFIGQGFCITLGIDAQATTYCPGGWTPSGAACSAGVGEGGSPSPPDSDGDGTSDGNDSAPNNPGQGGGGDENGEGQAEDGSGTCGGDGQPACGSPGTGSGNGNTSGGGHDCNTPPSSTGDAILAQIAYQTWATRCAITGMGNAGPGNGTGNGDGSGEGTGGEFDGDAEGRDAAMDGDSEDPEREDVVEDSETEEPELDTSGYGYSRACVAAPTVTVFGQTITFDTGPMCQWLELASYFVLILAALGSARIINGGLA